MLDCFSIFRLCSTKLGQFRLQMCSTVLHPSKIDFDHDRGMFWPCSTVLVSFDHARQNSVCFDCKCVRPCSTQARYISTMIAVCFDHARLCSRYVSKLCSTRTLVSTILTCSITGHGLDFKSRNIKWANTVPSKECTLLLNWEGWWSRLFLKLLKLTSKSFSFLCSRIYGPNAKNRSNKPLAPQQNGCTLTWMEYFLADLFSKYPAAR